MAWTDGVDYSTGQLISATIWNQYMGSSGNLDQTAPGIVTTAGDTVYATGDNVLARLAKGTARQNLTINSGATAPEWTNSPASLMTAEGDILYASAANTPARLAKGTDNYALVMNGNVPNWEALSAGKILQATTGTGSTEDSSSSSTFAAGSVSATITCASSSNKVVIMCNNRGNAGATTNLFYDISRAISGGATTHNLSGESRGMGVIGPSTDYAGYSGFAMNFLDSPSTTSALTYKFAFRNGDDTSAVTIGQADEGAVIVLMEVSA